MACTKFTAGPIQKAEAALQEGEVKVAEERAEACSTAGTCGHFVDSLRALRSDEKQMLVMGRTNA